MITTPDIPQDKAKHAYVGDVITFFLVVGCIVLSQEINLAPEIGGIIGAVIAMLLYAGWEFYQKKSGKGNAEFNDWLWGSKSAMMTIIVLISVYFS